MSAQQVEGQTRTDADSGAPAPRAAVTAARPAKARWVVPVVGSAAVVVATVGVLAALGVVKQQQIAAAMSQPYEEPVETVEAEEATPWTYQPVLTAIGTLLSRQWVMLKNETAGVVETVHLPPGAIVEAGQVLVQLDADVEAAELKRAEADARISMLTLERVQTALGSSAATELELERAEAEQAVAEAELERIRAVMERKTIVAPFRARVGLSNVHVGQYLEEGTELTTLQGVDDTVYVDVPVPQEAAIEQPDSVIVELPGGTSVEGEVVARDALTNRDTRNTMLRLAVRLPEAAVQPGMSVRVRVPTGPAAQTVSVPSTAIRRGPQGDFVWLLEPDESGKLRAREQRVVVGGTVPGGIRTFLIGGIEPGTLVATSGSFKLRNGAAVAAAEAGRPEPAASAPEASVAAH